MILATARWTKTRRRDGATGVVAKEYDDDYDDDG